MERHRRYINCSTNVFKIIDPEAARQTELLLAADLIQQGEIGIIIGDPSPLLVRARCERLPCTAIYVVEIRELYVRGTHAYLWRNGCTIIPAAPLQTGEQVAACLERWAVRFTSK
jgi:hypothetical protein